MLWNDLQKNRLPIWIPMKQPLKLNLRAYPGPSRQPIIYVLLDLYFADFTFYFYTVQDLPEVSKIKYTRRPIEKRIVQ